MPSSESISLLQQQAFLTALCLTHDEFKSSHLPLGAATLETKRLSVFSHAFSLSRYDRLCTFSQEKSPGTHLLYNPLICMDLKKSIEEAKNTDDVWNLLLKINNAQMQARDVNDTSFSALMQEFGRETLAYLRVSRPEIFRTIEEKFSAIPRHISQLNSDRLDSIFCMGMCLINGIVQIPLNIAWFALSVACIGAPPAMVTQCNGDINFFQAFCCPLERSAMGPRAMEFDKIHACFRFFIPWTGVRAKYRLYAEESQQIDALRHMTEQPVIQSLM